jgi:hemolysin activation/secretion protein
MNDDLKVKNIMNATTKMQRSVPGALLVFACLVPIVAIASETASPANDAMLPDKGSLKLPLREVNNKIDIRRLSSGTANADVVIPELSVQEQIAKRKFTLQGLAIGDANNIDQAKVSEVMAPWLNRELSFAEFQEASQALADHLRVNGHPNAEIKISQMQFNKGQVAIAIAGLTPAILPVEPKLAVRDIKVQGVTAVSESVLKKALQPYLGRDLSVKELGEATEAVAISLRNEGYALAQAYLPPQKIDDGIVTIAVQEGIVDGSAGKGGIAVSSKDPLVKPEVIESFVAQGVVAEKPLNVNKLERALRVANELPGVESLTTSLAPGNLPGSTQVLAEVKSGKPIVGSLSADNFGNPYMGEGRINAGVVVNSPAGYGEQYFVNLSKAVGMESYKLGGQAPVGTSGLKLGASYSNMSVDVGGNAQLLALGINSGSEVASVFASYPLERSASQNTNLTASLDNKHYKNNSQLTGVSASSLNNDRVINAINLGASGDVFATWGGKLGWGVNLAVAHNDLSGNQFYRDNFDKPGADTQGNFNKLNANVNHIVPIAPDWYLYTSLSSQWADKNLDSAEKFQLGGPFGVRAYPVGEGLGDHGWLANVEVRHNVGETKLGNVEVFGFADTGGVTQFVDLYASALNHKQNQNLNTYELSGAGVGVGVTYKDMGNLRVMVAEKLGSNPNPTINNTDSDGRTDSTRVWVVGTVVF